VGRRERGRATASGERHHHQGRGRRRPAARRLPRRGETDLGEERMSQVLVLVELVDGAPAASTRELLAAAAILGEPAAVVVGEPGVSEGAAAALGALGAHTVYAASVEGAEARLVTPQ